MNQTLQDIPLKRFSKRELTASEKDALNTNIGKLLSNETCLKKLNDLLNNLNSKYKDFDELLSDILNGKNGFKLSITKEPAESARYGEAVGKSIVINSSTKIENQPFNLIHEIFHVANNPINTHFRLVDAIATIEGLNMDNFKKNTVQDTDPGSGFLLTYVRKYCEGSESANDLWQKWLERFQ